MNLSHFYVMWSFFIFASTYAMEQQQLARLIPYADYVPKENCPLIPLDIALKSTTFKNNYDDFKDIVSTKNQIIEFSTSSDINTTWNFTHCLTKIHKINREKSESQENKFENKLLDLYLESFSNQELTDLLQVTNPTECAALQDKLTAIITARSIILNNTDLLKKLDLDTQNPIVSNVLIEKSAEAKLLQSYSNSLNEKYTLYPESLYTHIKERVCNAFSFSQQNNTRTHYLNTETGTIISSNYTTNIYNENKCEHIKIIKKNKPDIIINCKNIDLNSIHGISVVANIDESVFICELPHICTYEKGRKFIINCHDQSLIFGDLNYCFTENTITNCDTVYCIHHNGNITIKNLRTNITTDFHDWNNNLRAKIFAHTTGAKSHRYIYGIAINQNGNVIALNSNDKIFIGIRTDKAFVFTKLKPPTPINETFWHGRNYNIAINNEGNTLFIINNDTHYITVCNICSQTFSTINLLPTKQKSYLTHSPSLIQNGKMLIIPTNENHILFNTKTNQCWSKENSVFKMGYTHNKEQIIQEKIEYSSNSFNNNKKTTEIITLINDNIKKTVNIFHKGNLPLIYYTIALNPPGFLALDEDDYNAYLNLTNQERAIIDASYTITRTSRLSHNYTLGKMICKKIAVPIFMIAGLAGYLAIYITLQNKYPHYMIYVNKCLSAAGKIVEFLR